MFNFDDLTPKQLEVFEQISILNSDNHPEDVTDYLFDNEYIVFDSFFPDVYRASDEAQSDYIAWANTNNRKPPERLTEFSVFYCEGDCETLQFKHHDYDALLTECDIRPKSIQGMKYLATTNDGEYDLLGVVYCSFLPYFDYTIAVHPAHRNKGIGTELTDKIVHLMLEYHNDGLIDEFDVDFTNPDAEKLFKKSLAKLSPDMYSELGYE